MKAGSVYDKTIWHTVHLISGAPTTFLYISLYHQGAFLYEACMYAKTTRVCFVEKLPLSGHVLFTKLVSPWVYFLSYIGPDQVIDISYDPIQVRPFCKKRYTGILCNVWHNFFIREMHFGTTGTIKDILLGKMCPSVGMFFAKNGPIQIRSYELTTWFGWELVRLILRDLGHCPRCQSHRGQWAGSRGINPDSDTKRIDNSGSAITVLATKYLYNDAKCLLLSERWVLFLTCRPSLLFWSRDTNRPISIKKMGLLPCQLVCCLCKNVLLGLLPCQQDVVPWDYALVLAGHPPILNELENQ